MASRNLYSPRYDNDGNVKPSIPELATAIKNARLDVEDLAQQSQAARDDTLAARDEALEAANDLGSLGGVDGTAENKTGSSTLEKANGTTVDASNHSGDIWYVVGETAYYESNGTDWVQTGPDLSDASRLTKGTVPDEQVDQVDSVGALSVPSAVQEGKIYAVDGSESTTILDPGAPYWGSKADAIEEAITGSDTSGASQTSWSGANDGAGEGRVIVPRTLLPYDASAVSFDPSVEMVEELTSDFDVQVQAYGGSVADALAAKDPDVSEKYPGAVKAKWWISSGDGSPSSPYEDGTGTAGIQPAINYLQQEARGGKIILPRGLSRMTGTVTLDGYPFIVEGQGRPRTWNEWDEDDVPTKIIHEPETAGSDAVRLASLTGPCRGTRFRDFGLVSVNANSRDGIFLDAQDDTGRYGDSKTASIEDVVFDDVLVGEFDYGISGLGTVFHINHHNCWLTRNRHGLHYENVKNLGGPISQIRCTGQGYANNNSEYGLWIGSNDIYLSDWGTVGNSVGVYFNTVHAVISKMHSENDVDQSIVLESSSNKASTLIHGSNISGADVGIKNVGDKLSIVKSLVGGNTAAVDLTPSSSGLLIRDGRSRYRAPIEQKVNWAQVVYPAGLKYAEGTSAIPAGGTLRIEAAKKWVKGGSPILSWAPAGSETSEHEVSQNRVQFDDGTRTNVVWELTERTGREPVDINWTLWLSDQRRTTFIDSRVNIGTIVQTETSGQATLTGGSTSVTVSHGLDVTPDPEDIRVNALGDLGAASYYYITGVGASSFDINVDADPGQDVDFAWGAEV